MPAGKLYLFSVSHGTNKSETIQPEGVLRIARGLRYFIAETG